MSKLRAVVDYAVDRYAGCCGIAVVSDGCFAEEMSAEPTDFDQFIRNVQSCEGEVGTILFADKTGGPLLDLYRRLVPPPKSPWKKKSLVGFINPKTGNRVALKALVRVK